MSIWDSFLLSMAKSNFNKKREAFYEDLAEAIEDREGVAEFLTAELGIAAKRNRELEKIIYDEMLKRMNLNEGRISTMLDTIVPGNDILALRAVDDSDNKPESLRFLAGSIRRVKDMSSMVKKALAGPAMTLPILLAFAIIISIFIIPEYEKVASADKWPPIGKALYTVCKGITNWGLVWAILAAALGYLFYWSLGNWYGDTRRKFDNYLPYKVYRDYQGANFLVALASLLKAKQSLAEALDNLRQMANPWLRWHINTILSNMDKYPEDYGRAFATGLFSDEIEKRIFSFARRSDFNNAMIRIGSEGMIYIKNEMQKTSSQIGFIALVTVATGMLFFYGGSLLTAQGLTRILRDQSSNKYSPTPIFASVNPLKINKRLSMENIAFVNDCQPKKIPDILV